MSATATRQVVTDELQADFREAFTLFDRQGDGSVATKEMGTVMRALGQNPTEAELADWIREVDPRSRGYVSFEVFVDLMIRKMKNADTSDELRAAFEVFDPNKTGFIPAAELREVMKTLGECLTDEQVDEMIRMADVDGTGRVDYGLYIRLVFADASTL